MRLNELIPLSRHDDGSETDGSETTAEGEIWDRPPVDDARDALFRKSDIAENRPSPWGHGDARTWAWIALMFFGFLLFTAFIYFLPYGRNAAPPPVRVY